MKIRKPYSTPDENVDKTLTLNLGDILIIIAAVLFIMM